MKHLLAARRWIGLSDTGALHATVPPKPSVCMIAYTDYTVDARVRREAETLASEGFRVLCLTTHTGRRRPRFSLGGVEIRELAARKYRGKSTLAYFCSYFWFLLLSSATCLRLTALKELDIVHAHNLPDFLVLAGLVPRLTGKKVVLDVHDSVPETFATKFAAGRVVYKALCAEERLSGLVAHKVICVNHPQRDVLVSRGLPESKAFISMNVPDPRIFRPAAASAALPSGIFRLVYHGTMAERLGVDLLIRAVARLQSQIPGVQLHLWGAGDDLPAFKRLAEDLDVQARVLFKPEGVPLDQLPGNLQGMNIGLIGNRRTRAGELMLPVKLLEYVALGIPAVVPRLRTITYYFSDEMVAFYQPEDVGSLSDAIYRLYAEPERRRLQAAAAKEFLATHGWQRQGGALVALYRNLLEQ